MYGILIGVLLAVTAWYLYNKFNNTAFSYVDSKLFPQKI